MSGTQYAKPYVLRLDQRDRELLIRSIHDTIENLSGPLFSQEHANFRRDTLDRFHSMLERLCE